MFEYKQFSFYTLYFFLHNLFYDETFLIIIAQIIQHVSLHKPFLVINIIKIELYIFLLNLFAEVLLFFVTP